MEKVLKGEVNKYLEMMQIAKNADNFLFNYIINHNGDLFVDSLRNPQNAVAISVGDNVHAVAIGNDFKWLVELRAHIKFTTNILLIVDYLEIKEFAGDKLEVKPIYLWQTKNEIVNQLKENFKNELHNDISSVAYIDLFEELMSTKDKYLYFYSNIDEIYTSNRIVGRLSDDGNKMLAASYILVEDEEYFLFDNIDIDEKGKNVKYTDIELISNVANGKKGILLTRSGKLDYKIQDKYLTFSRMLAKI